MVYTRLAVYTRLTVYTRLNFQILFADILRQYLRIC